MNLRLDFDTTYMGLVNPACSGAQINNLCSMSMSPCPLPAIWISFTFDFCCAVCACDKDKMFFFEKIVLILVFMIYTSLNEAKTIKFHAGIPSCRLLPAKILRSYYDLKMQDVHVFS